MIKLLIYEVLIVNLFLPWGVALDFSPRAIAVAVAAITGKTMLLGIVLAAAETGIAKMRLFRVPQFLGLAFILSLIGILSYIILETN